MAIVRKDKLLAGYNGNLESVIVHDNAGATKVKTTNGVFVVVEGLLEGQREVKKARLAGASDVASDVLLIHNAEVMYDERKSKLADFEIEAGKVARGYRLYDGDVITLTTDLYAGVVAVGDKLVAKSDGKLAIATVDATAGTDEVSDAKVVFEVIENSGFELDAEMEAYAVQVVRN